MQAERHNTCNVHLGRTKNRYNFFQPTKLDRVRVCQSRGTYEANRRVILFVLHEHKLITLQITMP
jgi:hypothetical protein